MRRWRRKGGRWKVTVNEYQNSDKFTIRLAGGNANCPICGGMANVPNPRWIICGDCNAAFLVHRDGELEGTVVAERVR